MENGKWIYFSIYSEPDSWDFILKKILPDYLVRLKNIEIDTTPLIHFGHYRGAYVGYSLEVPIFLVQDVLIATDKIRFQLEKEAITRGIEQSLFLPFPTNSLQFGLHSFPLPENKDINFSRNLTEAFLIVFDDEVVNFETLFTFSLYVHILLLRASVDNIEASYNAISAALMLFFIENKETEEYNDYFRQDLSEVEEIIRDLFSIELDGGIADQIWIKHLYNAMLHINKVSDIRTNFLKYSNIINQQLGLNAVKIKHKLLYFIQQALYVVKISIND